MRKHLCKNWQTTSFQLLSFAKAYEDLYEPVGVPRLLEKVPKLLHGHQFPYLDIQEPPPFRFTASEMNTDFRKTPLRAWCSPN